MATQLSDYSNVTMPEFDKRVKLYLNTKIPLLNFFNEGKVSSTIPYNGEDYFYIPYQSALPEGGAWSGEMIQIPTALDPAFLKPYLSYKKYVHTIDMSQETMDLTKGKNAIKDGVKTLMSGAIMATKLNIDAALHGSGTGALATCVSYSGQVVTVDTTRYLRPGMVLDGYDADENHDADGIVVTAINSDTTFTCTGTVTSVDANTVLYLEGSWVSGTNRAANGIANIVDDDTGTFQGLSRDTYPDMQGVVTDGDTPGTNQALTIARMRGVLDDIRDGIAGESPDWIYTHTAVRNAYHDLVMDLNLPTKELPKSTGMPGDIGFYYDGKYLPVYGAGRATKNTMYFLNKTALFKYFGKMDWFKPNGQLWDSMQTASTPYLAVRANYTAFMNFGTDFAKKNGRLNDITGA